jgi:hypothetical protein
MATWKAGNYMNSGLSKAQYLAKSAPKKTSTKTTNSTKSDPYAGLSWADAAKKAQSQGVDTSTGGAFDLQMNKQFNPTNYTNLTGNDTSTDEGYIATPQYQAEINANKGKPTSTADFNAKNTAYNASNPKGISVPVTQREQAATAYKTPSTVIPSSNKVGTFLRNALDTGLDVGKNLLPGGSLVPDALRNSGIDITNLLGIPKAQAQTPFGEGYKPTPAELDAWSTITTSGKSGVSDQLSGDSPMRTVQDVLSENRGGEAFANAFSEATGNNIGTNRPKPTPVTSQPIKFNPVVSNPVIDLLSSYKDNTPNTPDNTPTITNQSTVRRFLGNGSPMSNGAFSNGKGYDGLEGASIGVNQDNENNLLNQILGINTAQASEMPQQSMANPFSTANFNTSPFGKIIGMPQQSINPFQQSNQITPQVTPKVTPKGDIGSQSKSSQGSSQGSSQVNQGVDMKSLQKQFGINEYGSMIKDTEKANQAAQRDLASALQTALQSINSQYDTSQTQGQDLLNKQKQEADLKLSGLFNFANQDTNSEQRMQYQQRGNADAASQLADLIAKITQGRTQDTLGAQTNYNTNLANVRQQGVNSVNQLRQQKSSALQSLQDFIYKKQQDQISNSPKSYGGTEKNDSLTYMGNNAKGEPVYWNNRTKQQQVGQGLTKGNDLATAFASALGNQQPQQGGNFTGRYEDGQPVYVDENGQEYIEQQ